MKTPYDLTQLSLTLTVNMFKTCVIFAMMVMASLAMPRFLIVPIENVRFMQDPSMIHHRVARSAWPQEEAA